MLSTLPGGGLGFTGSQLLGFGLGAMVVDDVVVPGRPGGRGKKRHAVIVRDNAYSRKRDDREMTELLTILFQVIE